jgi:hypothetical protein
MADNVASPVAPEVPLEESMADDSRDGSDAVISPVLLACPDSRLAAADAAELQHGPDDAESSSVDNMPTSVMTTRRNSTGARQRSINLRTTHTGYSVTSMSHARQGATLCSQKQSPRRWC